MEESIEKGMEVKIKKPCKHELDPLTEYFRKGRIHGECIKCKCFLVKTYTIESSPKRERPKMSKKERRKLRNG